MITEIVFYKLTHRTINYPELLSSRVKDSISDPTIFDWMAQIIKEVLLLPTNLLMYGLASGIGFMVAGISFVALFLVSPFLLSSYCSSEHFNVLNSKLFKPVICLLAGLMLGFSAAVDVVIEPVVRTFVIILTVLATCVFINHPELFGKSKETPVTQPITSNTEDATSNNPMRMFSEIGTQTEDIHEDIHNYDMQLNSSPSCSVS